MNFGLIRKKINFVSIPALFLVPILTLNVTMILIFVLSATLFDSRTPATAISAGLLFIFIFCFPYMHRRYKKLRLKDQQLSRLEQKAKIRAFRLNDRLNEDFLKLNEAVNNDSDRNYDFSYLTMGDYLETQALAQSKISSSLKFGVYSAVRGHGAAHEKDLTFPDHGVYARIDNYPISSKVTGRSSVGNQLRYALIGISVLGPLVYRPLIFFTPIGLFLTFSFRWIPPGWGAVIKSEDDLLDNDLARLRELYVRLCRKLNTNAVVMIKSGPNLEFLVESRAISKLSLLEAWKKVEQAIV